MKFYNTNYEITYHKFMKDDPDKANLYYKKELLDIYGLSETDDFDVLTKRVSDLYALLKNIINTTTEFKNLLDCASSKLLSSDNEIGFFILHAYDTLYLMHQLNIEFIENNTVNLQLIQEMKEKI